MLRTGVVLAVLVLAACGRGGVPADDASADSAASELSFAGAPVDPFNAGATCAQVGCSGHGRCVVMQGHASCQCDEGFWPAGAACEPALLSGCVLPPVASPSDVNLWTDVVYSTPWNAPQRLDVAFPKSVGPHALVLVLHGGGWFSGDKFDHRDDLLRLAGQGYAAAAINYRLVQGWQNRFPAAISDARCAVRWLKANAGRLGADPGHVFVIGASAGGELSGLLATTPDDASLDDGTCGLSGSASVTTAASYYGRMDLSQQPIPDYLVQYIGRDGDWLAREADASPVRHVSATTVPMLLLHGQLDGTVPIAQSRLMRDALKAATVPVGLFELPDQGHAFPLFGSWGTQPLASCTTLKFLGHFAPAATLSRPVRTVIYVEKPSVTGEQLFLRGGHDLGLVQTGAFLGDAEPLRYLNPKNADSFLTKTGDVALDWFSDSALDWTCDRWPAGWGTPRSYAVDGYGEDPENTFGPHVWKFDVLMDGQAGDWFEFKTFVRGPSGTTWEGPIHQPGTPYATGNHWARKGFVTVVHSGQSDARFLPLP
jgi:acetyl esterase/lipase